MGGGRLLTRPGEGKGSFWGRVVAREGYGPGGVPRARGIFAWRGSSPHPAFGRPLPGGALHI